MDHKGILLVLIPTPIFRPPSQPTPQTALVPFPQLPHLNRQNPISAHCVDLLPRLDEVALHELLHGVGVFGKAGQLDHRAVALVAGQGFHFGVAGRAFQEGVRDPCA